MLICQSSHAFSCLLKSEELHCNFKIYTIQGNSCARVLEWPLCAVKEKKKKKVSIYIKVLIPRCLRYYILVHQGYFVGDFLLTEYLQRRKEEVTCQVIFLCDFLLSSHILITQWWNFNFILKQYSNKRSPKRKICIYQESIEIIIQRHI